MEAIIYKDPTQPKYRPPMRLSQKDINEDYDKPTPHPLQRKADPQFQNRKLPPMMKDNIPSGTTLASMMPPHLQPAKQDLLLPLDSREAKSRPRTRSQGPVTPAQNLPGNIRKKY